MKKSVEIFTDGACLGNPGAGGYGIVLRYKGKEKSLSEGFHLTTNNRMEMLAAISALQSLREPCKVMLFSDSQYVKQGISHWIYSWKKQGWKTRYRRQVQNLDLWKSLDKEAQRHSIDWRWVKGHSGHRANDICDALAKAAAKFPTEHDIEYEKRDQF